MENLRFRTGLAIFGVILALVLVVPNMIDLKDSWWFSKQKLNYGLDIQGGIHLVMGVDIAGSITESTARLTQAIQSEFTTNGTVATVKAKNAAEGEIEITFSPTEKDKVVKFMNDHYGTVLQSSTNGDDKLDLKYYDSYLADYKSKVIHQAIETIRNRIDEFGVAEPSISQQGDDRILIQLPGMADAEKAKQLINTAAKLDFMMVVEKPAGELQTMITEAEKAGNYDSKTLKYSEYVRRLNEDLKAKLPEKTMIVFERNENATTLEAGKTPFLVKTDTGLGGEDLDDAFVSFEQQYGNAEVSLRFNPNGASKFKALTGASINKRMAVVLDKVVKTAPVIQTQIANGQAVITLGRSRDKTKTLDEAQMISTSLRAGALPATLEQLEERRVGPTLGADSIKKAQFASYVGALLILIFMLARYKSMGAVSDVSLAINILSVFALLSWLGATLTLPGIAGIALTVGFAVDANVLINERIREELHKGASFVQAVKDGYRLAMSAILDSNFTTASTALVLLYFGTGPVKGFAVTLLIGIVTTLFANVFVSKVLVDTLVHRFNFKKLSV